jgi:hypothetical protein
MKKVVVASLLACVLLASSARHASAQAAQPAAGQVQMSTEEFAVYDDAMNKQTTPAAKAAAIEAYLVKFPNSAVKADTLQTLMLTYSAIDPAKTIDAADRLLAIDPNNIRALTFEVYFRKAGADAITDPAAKQVPLDAAAGFAQKGLAATKPAAMSDADFKTITSSAYPIFYSAIGTAALNKKDTATAIDAYKKELMAVDLKTTQTPGPVLQDTYFLGLAYLQSTPPDLLDCAFYVSRFVAYAPEPFKTQIAPTAKYCYKKFHGGDDGYDAVMAAAQANLMPPAGYAASIKPAPTAADYVNQVIASTPDLGVLAPGDKEFILQNGTPDQAAKVWDTVKGKSVEIPGALVIASSPTQLQVAVSADSIQNKVADFTYNMKAPDELTEPSGRTTPAEKLAYKRKKEAADKLAAQIATVTAVGQSITIDGTYASYTPNPIMITMNDGVVVLPKPVKAAPTRAPVHHAAAKR